MTDSEIHTRIAENFARQGLMHTLGARLEATGPGHCVISAAITPGVAQQQGFAHAGTSFSLADSAAGYAALSLMAPGFDVVSVEVKMNMLRPAVGVRLIATGSVLRAGKQITVVRADVEAEAEDGSRKLVAAIQGTMMAAPVA